MKLIDLTGQVFGRLTVLRREKQEKGDPKWICLCECGKEKGVTANNLNNGKVKSCGCLKSQMVAEKNTTHGLRSHPIYRVWADMVHRCYNAKDVRYHRYGGRGITVCERWRTSFKNFYDDTIAGYNPSLQFDRFPNNDGNYQPGNFRWATPAQNSHNSTGAKLTEDAAVFIKTSGKTTRELMEIYGVDKSTINRVRRGDSWK